MKRVEGTQLTSLRYTCRAIPWTPLSVISVLLLTTVLALRLRGPIAPSDFHPAALAVLAAASVLGLDDSARPLLQALPTRPIELLMYRVVPIVLVMATAAGGVAVGETAVGLSPALDRHLAAALIALLAVGIALHTVLKPRMERANEVAAAAPMCWVATSAFAWIIPERFATLWLHHSWLVVSAAVLATLVATNRTEA